MPKVSRTPVGKIREIGRVVKQAINEGAIVASDLKVNRSTRTRASYKVKADALDRVGRILGGKE